MDVEDQPGHLEVLAEATILLDRWTTECYNANTANPVTVLTRMCELVEHETASFFKTDPDPFDDRHPGRADPNCTLGHLLKVWLKSDDFIQNCCRTYIIRDQADLNVVTTRLLISLLPGLEAPQIFSEHENAVLKLFDWAMDGPEPLRTYSTGVLGYIMEGGDPVTQHKAANHKLVPVLMDRLHELIKQRQSSIPDRPFAHFPNSTKALSLLPGEKTVENKVSTPVKSLGNSLTSTEHSNSSWIEMEPLLIQSYQIFPLTSEVQQRMILLYLTPLGEYTELLPCVYTHNGMEIVFHYLDFQKCRDVRLSFRTVRYLAALLCHKKFGMDFIANGGLDKLIQVPPSSLAATGASLCLYYVSFFEECMERACQLSESLLEGVVSTALMMLECTHTSGVLHSVMFLSNALPFKVILDIFDDQDGLRRILNVLTMSEVLTAETTETDFGDDTLFITRQMIRYITYTVKRYFESHAAIMYDQIKQTHLVDNPSPIIEISPYKSIKPSSDELSNYIELLLVYLYRRSWTPVTNFIQLKGIEFLLSVVDIVTSWPAYTGKSESIRWIFDILTICSCCSASQLKLCQTISLRDEASAPSISILLGMADPDSDLICDAEVRKSALNVINNLVGAPCEDGPLFQSARLGTRRSVKRTISGMHVASGAQSTEPLSVVWREFRQHNGVMTLLKLLSVQTPLTGADAIRALACKVLLSLSRSNEMCQIMSKLPLLSNGQLQQYMKEPVLQDRRQEHVKFCKYATQLIEKVCGKPEPNTDITFEHIRRADVVAQTKIVYKEQELLQLMLDHLVSKGLTESAEALQKEAQLPTRSVHPTTPANSLVYSVNLAPHGSSPPPTRSRLGHITTPGKTPARVIGTPGAPGSGLKLLLRTPGSTTTPSAAQTANGPRVKHTMLDSITPFSTKVSHLYPAATPAEASITLDNIITSYLRKQHACCRNPVVTCPPFSLYEPHKCPEPAGKFGHPRSILARLTDRSFNMRYKSSGASSLDKQFKYSRFKLLKTIREEEEGTNFSCCVFSPALKEVGLGYDDWFLVGTTAGTLKLYGLLECQELETYTCHNSPITNLEPSRNGLMVLTSSLFGRPQSALWNLDEYFEKKLGFDDESYVEFSKQNQDRIVGTCEQTAKVFDITTGSTICTLFTPESNNYQRNHATFSTQDDMLLNDGVLWDINSGKRIHKFDKFNSNISGVFHPLGLEVIINSEVWDLRTFKLLQTAPALDQCQISFSSDQSVIYAAVIHSDDEEQPSRSLYDTSFRTFDAVTYKCLATQDLSRNIWDIATDRTDTLIAVLENHQESEDATSDDCVCRLYEVGAVADANEVQEEDEALPDDEEEDEDEEEEGDDIEGLLDELLEGNGEEDGDEDNADQAHREATSSSEPDDAGDVNEPLEENQVVLEDLEPEDNPSDASPGEATDESNNISEALPQAEQSDSNRVEPADAELEELEPNSDSQWIITAELLPEVDIDWDGVPTAMERDLLEEGASEATEADGSDLEASLEDGSVRESVPIEQELPDSGDESFPLMMSSSLNPNNMDTDDPDNTLEQSSPFEHSSPLANGNLIESDTTDSSLDGSDDSGSDGSEDGDFIVLNEDSDLSTDSDSMSD